MSSNYLNYEEQAKFNKLLNEKLIEGEGIVDEFALQPETVGELQFQDYIKERLMGQNKGKKFFISTALPNNRTRKGFDSFS